MKQPIKPTKKKITVNGRTHKVEYDVFLLIRNQSSDLSNHIAALYKYVQIYDAESTHTEDEEILYSYCMQIEDVIDIIKFTKEQEDEKEVNDKD
tara:strand:+ start:111 stop:392 length:282 start_codon:yes stop_codon:yes gene_type:complete